jgi:meiotic recombination protein SPO11
VLPRIGCHELAGILDLDDMIADDDNNHDTQLQRISFTAMDTCRKYAQIIAISGIVAELVHLQKEISLRDVYYSLKHLFRTQLQCNSRILTLGMMLGLKRFDMGIVPTAKGLVAGPLMFQFTGSQQWTTCFDADAEDAGILISSRWNSCSDDDVAMHLCRPQETKYLLVVEKEGVFRRLVKEQFCRRIPCIMMTGCGFPDMASRALVAKVAHTFPQLIVVGLCDYNPYGIALLLTYKFPSKSTAFEGLGLQAEELKWLGLRPSQMMEYIRNEPEFDEESSFQPLSEMDKTKVRMLLGHDSLTELPEYQAEIEAMLDGDVKCELESLYSLGINYLQDFLAAALERGDMI